MIRLEDCVLYFASIRKQIMRWRGSGRIVLQGAAGEPLDAFSRG
jgi:hypothetical protein